MKKLLFFLLLVAFSINSHAEIYLDIKPFDTLADIKRKFPKAQFKKEDSWGREESALYTLTGDGVHGKLKIVFADKRPYYSKISTSESKEARIAKIMLKWLTDENIEVEQVIFIPDDPIPLERLISKYKSKGRISYSDKTFDAQMEWKDRGIQAFLSTDEKLVEMISFRFTKAENDAEAKKRELDYKVNVPNRNANSIAK